MIDNIDPNKILEQDPDFKAFAQVAVLELLKANPDMIKAMYGFFAIGMTAEQVGAWFKVNQMFGGK